MSTHKIGDFSEAKVLVVLLEKYNAVLTPFGNGKRYDFVVEDDGKFLTVQVKTGRLRNGTILFNSHSSGPRSERKSYDNVNFFAVYCPDTDGVYLIPCNLISKFGGSLRVDECRNNNSSKIKWAKDYLISGSLAER